MSAVAVLSVSIHLLFIKWIERGGALNAFSCT